MENQSFTDPTALSVLGVSESVRVDFHRQRGLDGKPTPSPLPLGVVSQGLIWERAQNGLKSQNISGEASLDIALYFRQVQGQPLALEFRSCASRPSLRWGACSCHPKLGMSRVSSKASEGSEICTLFDQAPKCQFFFLFKKKSALCT